MTVRGTAMAETALQGLSMVWHVSRIARFNAYCDGVGVVTLNGQPLMQIGPDTYRNARGDIIKIGDSPVYVSRDTWVILPWMNRALRSSATSKFGVAR